MNKRIVVWIGLVFNALNILSIVITYITASEIAKRTILKVAVLFVAIVCASSYLLLSFWLLRREQEHPRDVPSTPAVPEAATSHIYIGPGGMPVSLAHGKIRVDLRFFSLTAMRLQHVKVNVGTKISLSDAEPDDIKPSEIFTKILEQPLSDGIRQLLSLKSPMLVVEGTAKFSDGERKFAFQTLPLFM